LPAAAASHSLAAGDVDGDGLLDTIHTYTIGDPSVVGAWWIQISFANGGGTATQLFDESTVFSGATPVDGMDIDGDGSDEFFIYLGGLGSEVKILGLFDVSGCAINRVPFAGDGPASPPATLTVAFGIVCADANSDGLVDSFTESTGNLLGVEGDYTVTRRHLALVDGVLENRGSEVVSVPHGSPAASNIGKVICDGVVWS